LEKYSILYQDDNVEKIKTIMKVIGSPFNDPQDIDLDDVITQDLYRIAQKNKIGLFFLESLSKKKDRA
jgi:hypothetical protein